MIGQIARRGLRGSLAILVAGCLAAQIPAPAHADEVTGWEAELQVIINQSSVNLADGPPEVAREMAIVTAAMFDAVNAASGMPYQPYAYTGGAVAGVSADAAALTAGYRAVTAIFTDPAWQTPSVPNGSTPPAVNAAAMLAIANSYYATRLNALGLAQSSLTTPDLSACAGGGGALAAICGGISLGTATAAAVTAKQANDGSQAAIISGFTAANYNPGSGPGAYVQPAARPAMFPTWGTVTPMGLSAQTVAAAEASVPGPPALDSQAYANALLETECAGSGTVLPAAVQTACAAAGYAPETTAQAVAALFWNDPGGTNQPPGHWLQITETVSQSQNLDTLQAARLAMLVSLAENDAGIAAWGEKYQYSLWRPVTAIRDCASGSSGGVTWNPYFTTCDANWSSLIATPPHPDYLAGHPAFSGAAATVLANFFGTDNISFSSSSETYCNTGTPWRGSDGLIEACTLSNGEIFSDPLVTQQAACTDIGGSYDPTAISCTLDGTTYGWTGPTAGCNDIVMGGANDSPLICPITETYASFSDASSGPNGAEYSRIAGGIHTPFSVADALDLGNAIGQDIAVQFDVAAPGSAALFAPVLVFLAFGRPMGRRMGRGPVRMS